MKFQKILLPTDFSDESLYALSYAVDLAKMFNAKLYLLHVIYDIEKASNLHVPHPSITELYKDLEAHAKRNLDGFGVDLLEGFKNVETAVLRGIPYEEIIKFSKENNIDLIIIGTLPRSGVERFFVGSTTQRVIRNAPCPVLVVTKKQ
ncbi:nucleotide-binding universal stress protein, UspA family [Thermodesulfovibrio aggregans]|uniref:Universal stress protein n=1 Tax=Thermodesulfovibrio aggregans TaxID=86166 RepID=A0A0U9IB11_9BACT|nr:universal stress protein [Thermodesulfovibrio aggregans]GAQ95574.1 nucleotide-binding universal stress protein, UspA family [Thermodesulfovibrio aggregans]